MDFIRTHTGKFHFDKISSNNINIEDIAWGLSRVPRYGGQSDRVLYVGEHSYNVSKFVKAKNALAGLLHDASEAFLGDIVTPLKTNLPEYKVIEEETMKVICKTFGLHWPFDPEVKIVDKNMFFCEYEQVFNYRGPSIDPYENMTNPYPNFIIKFWGKKRVYNKFMERFKELIN